MAMRSCVLCGGQFKANPSGKPQQYCGAKCRSRAYYLKANRRTDTSCQRCGGVVSGEAHGNRTFCSDRCKNATENAKRYKPRRHAAKPCLVCGQSFTPIKWHARYCCARCNFKALLQKPSRRKALRARADKRRALQRGAERSLAFSPGTIFNRDGWRCQMCGVSTPKSLRGNVVPNAPTIDHIIPLSKGGDHTPDNTQCACLKCNRSKGARIIGQMRLSLGEAA
jgi:5-methylcytosine-specific restriction endonuclease McrA